jgi:hypothetical protein
MLKKEFSKRDVTRMRNLVTGKYDEQTRNQVGYSSTQVQREEGETWEELGKTWTMKNGVKQTISKLDSLRKSLQTPLACPTCEEPLNYWLHKKIYRIHGFCYNCLLKYEALLKKTGRYEIYLKQLQENNLNVFLTDLEAWTLTLVNSVNTYVTEAGDIEEWTDVSKESKQELLIKLQDYIKAQKALLEK